VGDQKADVGAGPATRGQGGDNGIGGGLGGPAVPGRGLDPAGVSEALRAVGDALRSLGAVLSHVEPSEAPVVHPVAPEVSRVPCGAASDERYHSGRVVPIRPATGKGGAP